MFIGGTGRQFCPNLIWALTSYSIDEHLAGNCHQIGIEFLADGSISVEDDGAGFPVDDYHGVPFLEAACTSPGTKRTFDEPECYRYGSGVSSRIFLVSVYSAWMRVETTRSGNRYSISFSRGVTTTPLANIGRTEKTGTRVTFLPDPEIFPNFSIDLPSVFQRVEDLAFLLPGLSVTFKDHRSHRFHQPTGIRAYADSHPLPFSAAGIPTFSVEAVVDDTRVDVTVRWYWREHMTEVIESFANTQRTGEGGTHVRGLKKGLADGLRMAAPQRCRNRRWPDLYKAICRGMHGVIQVRLTDAGYCSSAMDELGTPLVEAVVRKAVAAPFAKYLRSQPDFLKQLVSALPRAGRKKSDSSH